MMMKRIRVTAYMYSDLVKWIDSLVDEGRFRSRSHGIEESVQHLRLEIKQKILKKSDLE